MWMNKKLALALSLGVFAACGGDDDGGSSVETEANPASATATVSQMNSFGTSFASADGPSTATAAYSMGLSAGGIVVPAAESGEQTRQTGPAFASPEGCVCDETSCTFTECGDVAGTWEINGTISKSGDTYTFDYTMDFNQVGYVWTFATDGEITISTTLIDGSLSSDGDGTFDDGQGNQIESSWAWDLTANDIGLDGTGCATSGSMDASVDYSGSVNGQSYSYSGDATVTFGPACGQAQ
jgi:hypothetical protein